MVPCWSRRLLRSSTVRVSFCCKAEEVLPFWVLRAERQAGHPRPTRLLPVRRCLVMALMPGLELAATCRRAWILGGDRSSCLRLPQDPRVRSRGEGPDGLDPAVRLTRGEAPLTGGHVSAGARFGGVAVEVLSDSSLGVESGSQHYHMQELGL